MRKINYSILFLIFTTQLFCQPLTQVENFGKNLGNLKMYNYIPSHLNLSKKNPLVVVLHGCTQSAEKIANETGWNKLADSLNFVIVYPEQRQINNVSKCFNFFLGYKAKKDKGEVASIKQMIDHSLKYYNIDSSRVFITGMSAGGGMSNAMLNAYPTIFNAGALIAAPSNVFNLNEEFPTKQPRIAILQGEDDRIVPKRNADKILSQWVKKNQFIETDFELKDSYLDNPLLTAKYFYSSTKELKIIIIVAESIKHKLLIKPGASIKQGGIMDIYTQDINFHSTYWIANFFGLVPRP